MGIETDIKKMKKLLIGKAKRKGLYENFGDKEERKLRAKYPTGYMGEKRKNMDLLDDFAKWARNVNYSDLI